MNRVAWDKYRYVYLILHCKRWQSQYIFQFSKTSTVHFAVENSRIIPVLDNHLYSILSILPDFIFHIPSLTPLFSSSITFSFLIVIRLHHTINANAISVETPYDALSSPKMFQNRTHCHGPNRFTLLYSLL